MSKSQLNKKLQYKIQNFSIQFFFNFVRKKNESLRFINGSFATISGHFSANYTNTCLSQNWGSEGNFEVLNGSKSWIFKIWQLFFFWDIKTPFGTLFRPKRPFYNHLWSLFCQLHRYLSQNWDSGRHFEVCSVSKS